ncbi:MAG: hypothetical protein LBT32_04290 [Peptococcaceae bacterium]|jgi:hypothetical protein|nr:hypothetical protein [Peptococcaceae bacterium]
MLMLKVCHTCERVLGEIEIDDSLSRQEATQTSDWAISADLHIIGNVVYTICPDCLAQMYFEPAARLQ